MSRSLWRRGPGTRLGPQGRDAQKKKGGGPHRGNGRRYQQKFASTSVLQNSHHKKAPQDAGAGSDRALSREERTSAAASEGSLADGNRFADYSGGTAADLHGTSALPTPANCRLSVRCVRQGVNEVNKPRHQQISGFSSLACAFRPVPVNPPGNLPGDKARLEKYSWSF